MTGDGLIRELTTSAEETAAVGAALAAELRPGGVVLVSGELGSGKTTLVRGACRALGVEGPVTSPTYTIGHLYWGRVAAGPVEVAHLDLYRLAGLADEDPALLDDYLGPDRVAFVEWPGVAEDWSVGEGVHIVARVRLEHAGEGRRMVEVRR